MKKDMKTRIRSFASAFPKKPLPILSFPCVSLLGVTVRELIADSELQAKGMNAVADRVDAAAAVSFMDLSVEAECFGATVTVSDDEGVLRMGTPTSVRKATDDLMRACAKYPNFLPSSGCVIPPLTPWENIDAFFETVMCHE